MKTPATTLRFLSILRGLHDASAHDGGVGPATGDVVTVGEVFDRAEHAGFGVVIALLAIVSLPLVGLTLPIAVAVTVVGMQMILGQPRPWLPQFIRNRRVSVSRLHGVSARVSRWSLALTRFVRPRLPWLMRGPGWVLCGLGVMLQGAALGMPLPGADWLFAAPLVLYGVALLESDGLLIIVGHVMTATEIILAWALWELVAQRLAEVWTVCSGLLT